MSHAGDVIFGPGDPNLDNQKRNIAVRVFTDFRAADMVEFGRRWLEKWKANSGEPWYQEWVGIFHRADPAELTDILLSHEPDRVRQRSSSPLGEMLGFDVVLKIKRETRHEKR